MSERSRKRTWTEIVLFTIGALLIGQALYYNFTAVEPGELKFQLMVNRAGPSFMIEAAGSRKIYEQRFNFDGTRISFTGDIQGDRVSITGTMRSNDEGVVAREFKAEGRIADNRAVVPLMTPKGSRIGKIELSLIEP
ncbi:MAG: hypothetical protein ACKVOI_19470 [Dongiaceae bacterium]